MNTGISLFLKAVSIVFSNLSDAVRVSGVIYIIYGVITVAVTLMLTGTLNINAIQNNPQIAVGAAGSALLVALISAILGMVVFAWIAVAWHRFVLVEDYPAGVVPRFDGQRIMRYIWRSILLGLIIAVCAIIPMMIVGTLAAAAPVFGVLMIAVIILLIWLSSRLSIVLPALAVDREFSFTQAWEATKPLSMEILVASVLCGLGFGVAGAVLGAIMPANIIGVIINLAFQWVATMVGLSLITTIYGHAVEGRPI